MTNHKTGKSVTIPIKHNTINAELLGKVGA